MGVSSVGGNSSIYGQRNVLSGIASGMDTESMIENMTLSTRLKIQQQKQKKTLLGWRQEAYRGISSQLIEFSKKYTDYQSSTNLMSPSFFDQRIITSVGKNSDLVSAIGKTDSDIIINGVKQMATSTTHSIKNFSGDSSKITGDVELDIGGSTNVPTLNGGSFTIQYGEKDYVVNLGENEDYSDPEKLQEALNKALKSVEIGKDTTLADKVEFTVSAGGSAGVSGINLRSKDTAGNTLKLKEVSSNVKEVLGFDPPKEGMDITGTGIAETVDHSKLETVKQNKDLLAGKQIQLTFNGKPVTITFDKEKMSEWDTNDKLVSYINKELDKAYGAGKVSAGLNGDKLEFSIKDGGQNDVLRVNGGDADALKVFGMEVGDGNRINMNKTLGELYGDSFFDTDGKGVITINDVDIEVNKDMTMREMMDAINDSDAGVTATYSELSDTMKLTAKETGEGHRIDIGAGLGSAIFYGGEDADPGFGNQGNITREEGKNAIIDVTVNGEQIQLERSSNTINIDGLEITVSGTFGDYTSNGDGTIKVDKENDVTFTSKPQTDKITEAVKEMVEAFNKLLKDTYKEMSTKPNKEYQPLTDEQREEMTEDQIEKWEEKAKEGLLFGDSQLRGLQSELRTVFSPGGEMTKQLERMGITFEWSINTTDGGGLKFDEDKFRKTLEADPDAVKEVFTKPASVDSNGNPVKGGVMVEMKRIYESYASTSIVNPGALVARAGSPHSPNSILKNTLQNEINDIDKTLKSLNTRLKKEIDRYNRQFTQLEMLVSQMNGQSANLAGLMGGGM